MRKPQDIYKANKSKIDELLSEYGYPCSYEGFLSAIRDRGDSFLHRAFLYSFISWDNADGEKSSWWNKFRNIFHTAADTVQTASDVTSGADLWLNPNSQDTSANNTQEKEEQEWKPNLLYWLLGALLLIIILVVIFIFTRK